MIGRLIEKIDFDLLPSRSPQVNVNSRAMFRFEGDLG